MGVKMFTIITTKMHVKLAAAEIATVFKNTPGLL